MFGRCIAAAVTTAGICGTLAVAATPANADTYYRNCTAARNAGVTDIQRGDPGYRRALDRDGDGVACESGSSSSGGSASSSDTSSSDSSGGGSGVTVSSGTGGGADRNSSVLAWAVGGLGVLVLSGSATALARRPGE